MTWRVKKYRKGMCVRKALSWKSRLSCSSFESRRSVFASRVHRETIDFERTYNRLSSDTMHLRRRCSFRAVPYISCSGMASCKHSRFLDHYLRTASAQSHARWRTTSPELHRNRVSGTVHPCYD